MVARWVAGKQLDHGRVVGRERDDGLPRTPHFQDVVPGWKLHNPAGVECPLLQRRVGLELSDLAVLNPLPAVLLDRQWLVAVEHGGAALRLVRVVGRKDHLDRGIRAELFSQIRLGLVEPLDRHGRGEFVLARLGQHDTQPGVRGVRCRFVEIGAQLRHGRVVGPASQGGLQHHGLGEARDEILILPKDAAGHDDKHMVPSVDVLAQVHAGEDGQARCPARRNVARIGHAAADHPLEVRIGTEAVEAHDGGRGEFNLFLVGPGIKVLHPGRDLRDIRLLGNVGAEWLIGEEALGFEQGPAGRGQCPGREGLVCHSRRAGAAVGLGHAVGVAGA